MVLLGSSSSNHNKVSLRLRKSFLANILSNT
jgi:hypothetical protein